MNWEHFGSEGDKGGTPCAYLKEGDKIYGEVSKPDYLDIFSDRPEIIKGTVWLGTIVIKWLGNGKVAKSRSVGRNYRTKKAAMGAVQMAVGKKRKQDGDNT